MNAIDDADQQASLAAFLQALEQSGWTDGRNIRIDIRWARGDARKISRDAAEMVALAPDVILAPARRDWAVAAGTHTMPIVFVNVADPVGAGFVESLARPGGNVTGFTQFEYSSEREMAGAAQADRTGRNASGGPSGSGHAAGIGQFAAIQSAAPSVGVEVSPVNVRDAGEIERAVAAFARASNGGLIVTASALAVVHRELIVALAARHKLPAVYYRRYFVTSGGLISYGPDVVDQFRRAAGYVDRILKGEKPADLPVQAPTKYELVINLKTAKALGLDVPAIAARPRRRGDRMKTARVHHAARRRGGRGRSRRARSSRRCR